MTTAVNTPTAARPCFFCGLCRPLFAGVCTPCEDREKGQQRVDAYMPRYGRGRSSASIWRTACARAAGNPDYDVE